MKNNQKKIEFIIVKIGNQFIREYEICSPSLDGEAYVEFSMTRDAEEAYRFHKGDKLDLGKYEYDREVLRRIEVSNLDESNSIQFFMVFRDENTNELKYSVMINELNMSKVK